MTTGEVKNILVECLVEFLTDFQARRAAVTDEMVSAFMQQRKIDIDLTNVKDLPQ
jgi:tryptophanyl-tRNA synthetase